MNHSLPDKLGRRGGPSMELVIAAIIAIGAAVGVGGKKEGLFQKGSDTTYRDTVDFEVHSTRLMEQSAHNKVERLEAKEREPSKEVL